MGAKRSGTTVLRLMLDAHPRVSWFGEFEYAVLKLADDGSWPDVREYVRWLSSHRIFRNSGFHADPTLSYPELLDSFLAQRRAADDKPIVGATVHRRFDLLRRVWPGARFIHIVRDPRDVARSAIGMGWAGNVWVGADGWIEAERLWEQLRAELPDARRLELRYEDVILQPETELKRVCAFLGVGFDPEMLDYPRRTSYRPPDPSLVAQWRRKLDARAIRLVEARVGDLLTTRGYEPSGLEPLHISPRRDRCLRRRSRAACVFYRMRRYGWRLWIADLLSRRVGPRVWRRHTQMQLNDLYTRQIR